MHKKFDHKTIEKKWQKRWRDEKLYEVSNDHGGKQKQYILTEYPYPSGNLHIGHWHAFAVPDIFARAKRMQGGHVLYPIGFDSFGLPAENAAIKNKLNPKKWTYENIERMERQLESMGNSYDWSRKVISSDPDYYRWTQLIFLQFFKKGLAYRGISRVNWCPSCNTVLANEQVVNGACERCDSEVEHREMPQWLLRITDYADRLINDLDSLDWPEPIKTSQRNWIGRSDGVNYQQKVKGLDIVIGAYDSVPQTFMAQTFAVIAPEHPLVSKLVTETPQEKEVLDFVKDFLSKKSRVGFEIEKTMDGIFTGRYIENPFGTGDLPIWVASFVVADYGTGFVNCSVHDERDFAFAKKYGIPLRPVMFPEDPVEAEKVKGLEYCYHHAENGVLVLPTEFAGRKWGEIRDDIIDYIEKKGFGSRAVQYKLRDWSVSRQRYWGCPIPIVYDPEGKPHAVPDAHLPWPLPEDVDFTPTGVAPLAKSAVLKKRTVEIFGEGWTPEVETLDTFVDSSWYFLRYTDPENTEIFASKGAQGAWMPVDTYFGGAEHTTLHLLYARFVQKVLYDMGLVTALEPFRVRINRGLVLGPDGNKMSKSRGNVIDPDEQVSRLGADTVKMYLAFMGPYGEVTNYPWAMGGIAGIRRFLERVNGLVEHVRDSEPKEMTRLLHQTIDKVTRDIEHFKFNTAISAMMIFVNAAEKEGLSGETYKTFLRLLAPFAPHLTEELWERAGEAFSIHQAEWPVADQSLLVKETITIAVQIDGKVRATITVPVDADEQSVRETAMEKKQIADRLADKQIIRVVYVSGKVLNLIT